MALARKKSRGNGDGDVWPRKNKEGKVIGYRGTYFAPDGKRRYVSGKTKEETRAKKRQALADADRGLVFEAETVIVEEYLNR